MIPDIWRSFRSLPIWVQIWVALILFPANMASLLFWSQPNAPLIATLAVGAMAINGIIMFAERGFSKAMALPHVVIWTPLVIWLGWLLLEGQQIGNWAIYLLVLLVIDVVSLGFDFKDTADWWQGQRQVAGR